MKSVATIFLALLLPWTYFAEEPIVTTVQDDAGPDCTSDPKVLHYLTDPPNYEKLAVPSKEGVDVDVAAWVQEITAISDTTSDVQLDMYISEMWTDDALRYDDICPEKRNLSLKGELVKTIWTPNTCFVNSKISKLHESPFKNIFFMIFPNGSVWLNYRLRLTGPCTMDYTAFPFDNIICRLTYESFNYNAAEVRLHWGPTGASKMRHKMEFSDYMLTGIATEKREEVFPAGRWHDLHIVFTFKRLFGWYIFQCYLPTYLSIFVSWISFALGTQPWPARTMLGINSMLSMTMQFGNVIRNLPRVSYVKAIDVWMMTCMSFVFCSLLELGIIGYVVRWTADGTVDRIEAAAARWGRQIRQGALVCLGLQLTSDAGTARQQAPCLARTASKRVNLALRIDQFSLVIFPIFFAFFNLFYWGYYFG